MPPTLAACLYAGFILWLFARDTRQHDKVSSALWIPLVWAFILGSKPISQWLGAAGATVGPSVDAEDGLLDKAAYLFLIVVGLTVLLRRRVDWSGVARDNKWVFLYFAYIGASVLWADDPFVSFKRWFKDVGNVVMVLIVLTDDDPVEATKVFLARCAYLLIPLSVLVVKYYPAISRGYSAWDYQPVIFGIATNKNLFGMTLYVCGLSLVWMLLESRDPDVRNKDWSAVYYLFLLMLMTGWLLLKAKSATALCCVVFGGLFLLGMRVKRVRDHLNWLGGYLVAGAVFAFAFQIMGVWDALLADFSKWVGRDPSLHGRSEIWRAVLTIDINPLFGVGFSSFWSPARMQQLSKGYFYFLNEAHNGYIETYLNCGLIGVLLLVVMLSSAIGRMKRAVLDGSNLGPLRLGFALTIIVYNITEATFDRLSLVWLVLLLVMMEYRSPHKSDIGTEREEMVETFAASSPVGQHGCSD
jgi:exopolysaccharide production protein ExoQ